MSTTYRCHPRLLKVQHQRTLAEIKATCSSTSRSASFIIRRRRYLMINPRSEYTREDPTRTRRRSDVAHWHTEIVGEFHRARYLSRSIIFQSNNQTKHCTIQFQGLHILANYSYQNAQYPRPRRCRLHRQPSRHAADPNRSAHSIRFHTISLQSKTNRNIENKRSSQ